MLTTTFYHLLPPGHYYSTRHAASTTFYNLLAPCHKPLNEAEHLLKKNYPHWYVLLTSAFISPLTSALQAI